MSKLVESLRREHEQLEGLLVKLSDDVESRDPRRLQETWRELESCLARHLRTEEQQLLPLFAASHPEEVRSTLTEHRRIRERVAASGIDVDLHLLSKNAVVCLTRMLREHARAEDRSLYGPLDQAHPLVTD